MDVREELQKLARSASGETFDLGEIAGRTQLSVEDLRATLQESGLEPLSDDGMVYDRFDVISGLTHSRPRPSVEDETEKAVVLELEEVRVAKHHCDACGADFWFGLGDPVTCPDCGDTVSPVESGSRLVSWNADQLSFEEGVYDG